MLAEPLAAPCLGEERNLVEQDVGASNDVANL